MMRCLFALAWFMCLLLPAAAQALPAPRLLETGAGALDAVAFSPDGTLLATGGRDHVIRLWDATSGAATWHLPGHTARITSLAFSPDGTLLASGDRTGTVMLWALADQRRLKVLPLHGDEVTGLAWLPAQNLLVSAGRDAAILFYAVPADAVALRLEHYGGPVWDIALSPDQHALAAAGEDGSIWVWGLQTDRPWLKQLTGHTAPVAAVAWSPDGRTLLSGGLDSTVRLWDLTDTAVQLTPRQTLHGHLAPVMGVGFGADGDTPVSAALDGTVRLWAGTAELAVYPDAGSGLPLTALAFNPDHSRSASTSTGGQILLQDVSRATLAQLRPPANTTRTAQPMAPASAAVPATTAALPAEGRNLIIPAAGIRTALTSFPLGAETWIIDPWERLAGHFAGTAWLTDTGNIVIGGHSEYPDGRGGVFRRLYNVGMGDEIFVTDGALQRRYLVVNVLTVNYTDLSVIYPTGFNRLTLITCDIPSYQPQQNMYAERLVVVADEVQP